jgi:hypothetical protein
MANSLDLDVDDIIARHSAFVDTRTASKPARTGSFPPVTHPAATDPTWGQASAPVAAVAAPTWYERNTTAATVINRSKYVRPAHYFAQPARPNATLNALGRIAMTLIARAMIALTVGGVPLAMALSHAPGVVALGNPFAQIATALSGAR